MDLRKQGFGYKRISEALNLSLGTVKSFCRRNENAQESARPDVIDTRPNGAVAESDEAAARPSEIDAQADETYAIPFHPPHLRTSHLKTFRFRRSVSTAACRCMSCQESVRGNSAPIPVA